ncbi:MAG TPA: ABC transporter permease [Bryobacteraceae bacterium]|nr:ABC transporter permease [Bryobacteraceae bacterium]
MKWTLAADTWWPDFKIGVRMLIKFPGLALVGGFGIAMAVAIAVGGFSIVYGNFRASSLALEEGGRIVSMEIRDLAAGKPTPRILHDYQTWRRDLKSIQEISAFRTITANLISPGAQPISIRLASMTASGFAVARVHPIIGRYLIEEDERQGAPPVVVIGESIWRHRFAADPAILGRTMQLGTTPHSIVGVMPDSFAFPVNHHFWVPLRANVTAEPLTGPDVMVFGRLAPGVSRESAQAELEAIFQRTALSLPKIYAQLRPQVLPYPYPFLGMHGTDDITGLYLMQGIVALLLVLVCLNVAILVYTRTAMRHGEIAIRTALGASRSRVVTQLFIEAFVLSAVAALAGIGMAVLALRYVAAATMPIASELPFWVSFQISPEAVLYAGALSVIAAAIVGIVPALKATRRQVQTGLRIIGAGGSGMRLGTTWTILIIAQVSFAVALLPAAVSNAWGTIQSAMADPGFAADEFLSAQLGDVKPDRQIELIRLLQAEPGVSSVTFAMTIPGDEPGALIETSGKSVYGVRFNRVDVNFFRVFDVPILAGRGFELADASESRAVVVNRTFAQRIFGGDALGRRLQYLDKNTNWYEIVGIVSDFPTGVSPGMDDSPLRLYHAAAPGQVQPATLAIRLRGGPPSTFAGRLREIATAVDPDLQLRSILSLDEALRRDQWIRRMEAAVLVGVTLSVLMLSAAGIYALMSFTISQRRKEIGIRMALGADSKRILASITSRALWQLAVGAALGMAPWAVLGKASRDDLMRGSTGAVLPVVALFMIVVGFLASLGPACRCLQIHPTDALREQ